VFDNSDTTKWFSGAREFGGVIVTPAGGPAVVQSLQFTTANDSPNRDPVTFQLFGTNNPVTTVNNGTGLEDNWTLVGSGATGFATSNLTATPRNVAVTPVDVSNSTAYSSYKVVFPSLRLGDAAPNTPTNPGGIQVSEVRMYNAPAGGGTNVALSPTLAVALDQTDSAYPPAENPKNLLDGNPGSKYLNFGREGSGVIIKPAAGATTVGSFQITTANDAPARDPAAYALYGTNDPITSLDNSEGDKETWTLISSGTYTLPDARLTDGSVVDFANSTSYLAYKFVVTDNKGPDANANSVQFGELKLFNVPEPSSIALVGLAGLAALKRRRQA